MSAISPQTKPAVIPIDMERIRRKTHWMIQKMTEDLDTDKFKTAISAAMELVNEVYGVLAGNEKGFESDAGKFVLQEAVNSLGLCLSPYAPYLCEELWRELGKRTLLSLEKWPPPRLPRPNRL